MDTLHMETWRRLGYAVDFVVYPEEGTVYGLTRNGKSIGASGNFTDYECEFDTEAWAQAPTLDTLMPKLVEAMTDGTPYFISGLYVEGGVWTCNVRDTDYAVHIDCTDAPTMAHAVASVFVKMCAEGLIDGKAVVL